MRVHSLIRGLNFVQIDRTSLLGGIFNSTDLTGQWGNKPLWIVSTWCQRKLNDRLMMKNNTVYPYT